MSGLPELPQLAGRYRLDEVLRRGSGVTTYGGVDAGTGAPIVVKALRVGDLHSWKELDLFRREVETLSALRHPAIPRVLASFTDDETQSAYLVMERVPGESLDRRLARGQPMTVAEVLAVLRAVLEVLAYLHSLAPPIIHRDLKPGNIMLSEGRVWVVDFGGVRRFFPWAKSGSTMVGTFGYLAPEQLHGDASPATDIYALGATIAALLAGCDAAQLPRDGLRIDLSTIPAMDPALRQVLARMLEPDAQKRVRSAAEAQTALGRIGLYGAASASPPREHPANSPKHATHVIPAHPALAAHRASSAHPATQAHHAMQAFDPPPQSIAPLVTTYWMWRTFARWGLVGVGTAGLVAAASLELIARLILFGKLPFLSEIALPIACIGAGLTAGGWLITGKGGYRRRILRLARRQGGRIHVAEILDRTGLPPRQARELMDELVAAGVARADPEVDGLYWIAH